MRLVERQPHAARRCRRLRAAASAQRQRRQRVAVQTRVHAWPLPVAASCAMNTSSSDGGDRPDADRRQAGLARSAARTRRPPSSPAGPSRTCSALAEHLRVRHAGQRAQDARAARRRSAAMTSSSRPASVARSAPGASSASTRPSCSSATRAQRSASSRYGVAITIVMPLREELRQQLPELAARDRIDAGRRLVEQDQLGSWTSVQASASFCFMPPDSRSASRVAERRELRHLEQPVAARAGSRARRGSRRRTRCSRRCVRSP